MPGLTQAPGSTVGSVFTFGGRSLSIWSAAGDLVADTGDELERLTYSGDGSWFAGDRGSFNTSNTAGSRLDDRSDNKGPEPEGVAVGTVAGTTCAFLGAERAGSLFAYDLSDPAQPVFAGYANTRPGDLGPEGVTFVAAADSFTGAPLVLATNEISGTLDVLQATPRP